jgi:hypothetical protein
VEDEMPGQLREATDELEVLRLRARLEDDVALAGVVRGEGQVVAEDLGPKASDGLDVLGARGEKVEDELLPVRGARGQEALEDGGRRFEGL